MKRVMVFGVFDMLHPGHLHFLYKARLEGGELIAVIARDAAVVRLKDRRPAWNEKRRARAVQATGLPTKVVLGDIQEGSYKIVKKHRPNVICVGYDQKRLADDLRAKMRSGELPQMTLRKLRSYKPDVFHTSIRRGPKGGAKQDQ